MSNVENGRVPAPDLAGFTPFGIYMPLQPESITLLRTVVEPALARITEQTDMTPTINGDFGVTFLPLTLVRNLGATGQQILAPPQKEQIPTFEDVDVQLQTIGWFGAMRLKLGFSFDPAPLAEPTYCVRRLLKEANPDTYGLPEIKRPRHITVASFDGEKSRRLNRPQIRQVEQILTQSMPPDGILNLKLGQIVVGTSYSQPLPSRS